MDNNNATEIMHGNGEEDAALRRLAYACSESDRHPQFYHDVTVFTDGHARHAIRDQDLSEPGARKIIIGHSCLPVLARLFYLETLIAGP